MKVRAIFLLFTTAYHFATNSILSTLIYHQDIIYVVIQMAALMIAR